MSRSKSLRHDQLVAMLETEAAYTVAYVPCTRLQAREHSTNPPLELDEWRRKICQWSFRVIDHLQKDREIVAVGMNIFDRFLLQHNRRQQQHRNCYSPCDVDAAAALESSDTACHCPSCKRILDSRTYQLAAMTSLYLAIKLHTDCTNTSNTRNDGYATHKRTFKLESFVELSRGQFVPADICAMEQTMLEVVQWQVHPPTPMMFCSYMLATLLPPHVLGAAKTWDASSVPPSNSRLDLVLHVIRELSRYLTELAVCLGSGATSQGDASLPLPLTHVPASRVAFCAILTAMELLTVAAWPVSIRDYFYHAGCRLLQCNVEHGPDAQLRTALQQALWPELLFDDKHTSYNVATSPMDDDSILSSSSGHPISMARDFGLLDMDRVYHGCASLTRRTNTSPPDSPRRLPVTHGSHSPSKPESVAATTVGQSQASPVSVARCHPRERLV